mgnify:FL=1
MSVPHDVVNVAGMGRGMPAFSRYSGFSYFCGSNACPPAMFALTDSGVAGRLVIEEFIYANPL